ncbi:hypothetical protein [Roseobacter weihaiensis]|uniref:hypothetical protein n=1 Tax=Roseobacter weihaiensis TaxID=2763262 RepID=UPI001D0B2E5E|nr:hypothetical protein [Roseobacter sp. H9]
MLRLSENAINTIVPDLQRKFDRRIVATLLEKYDGVGQMQTDGFVEYVAAARTRAQSLGFRAEQHIYDLVEACCLTGNALWSDPYFKQIIAAPFKTNEEKCVCIRRHFIPDLEPGLSERPPDE